AICILLHQLSALGARLKDKIKIFGHSQSYILLVFNDILMYLCRQFGQLLFWDTCHLTVSKISKYTYSVEKIVGGRGVWGWIDSTMRPFCRLGENQAAYYSGHKKSHSFQFQSIMTADGIMSSLHAPYTGPHGDWMMWNDSGIERILYDLLPCGIGEQRYYLYSDFTYWPSFGIMGPYRSSELGISLSGTEEAANLLMSGARISVEWGFGLNVTFWGINNYKKGSKILSSPVAAYYLVSTLLTNMHMCLKGRNIVSDKFNYSPPSLKEYVRSVFSE
ncbi:hypothetical protein C7212DRAFT_179586, partial [Tuber magnatum]